MRNYLSYLTLSSLALLGAGCAGSTLNSGVGDRLFQQPPYYAGEYVRADSASRIGHLPITYQAGATQSPIFDPASKPGSEVDRFLREMNAYLDSLGVTMAVRAGSTRGTPPNVQFGCERTGDDCEAHVKGILSRAEPPMKLAIARPSGSWISWIAPLMDSARVSRVLLITLETSDYWPRQTDLLGRKEVRLGTNYDFPVPWLTALDRPVSVLQITGALIGPDGKALRIGAEGLIAHRTSLLAGAIGAQALISDEDVAKARVARRTDLPGQPLVWQAALRNLVAELTGQPELRARTVSR